MGGFKDRKDTFEGKFAYDEEFKFKVEARRNKLLAHWVAGLLGKEVDVYTRELIAADLEEAGDEDVLKKIRMDIDASPVDVSDEEIRDKMNWLLKVATEQLENE